jgi:tripartite ATP-independent transporter DctM subunit
MLYIGIATPTEAAALGTAGMYLLAVINRGFQWEWMIKSVSGTIKISVMIFVILTGSTAFSQILAFTGISQGLVGTVTNLDLPPLVIVFLMQILLFFMGMFMEPLSIMMVTIPILFPIVQAMGMSPLWFGLLMLISMEMATISPPFGLVLFVMKGVAPKGTSMQDIYLAPLPFLAINGLIIIILMIFPQILFWWLPSGLR